MLTMWAYVLAMFFAFWSNRHFGGNIVPSSDAELVADGMVLVLTALAMIVHSIERKSK